MVLTARAIREIAESGSLNPLPSDPNNPSKFKGHDFIQRLIKQTKMISQLIAESWVPDPEAVTETVIETITKAVIEAAPHDPTDVTKAVTEAAIEADPTINRQAFIDAAIKRFPQLNVQAITDTVTKAVTEDKQNRENIRDAFFYSYLGSPDDESDKITLEEILKDHEEHKKDKKYEITLDELLKKKSEMALMKFFLVKGIFEAEELEFYEFAVDINAFEGYLTERHTAKKPFFKIVLPYPPKPPEACLKWGDIKKWRDAEVYLENDDIVKDPFPPAPYFPLSTC